MALLRTLHRAAFICNVCFLLALGLLYFKHPVNPGLTSLIIVMGFFLSVILNLIVNGRMIFLRLSKKPALEIPRFLIYFNAGFMIVQLVLLLKSNL
jgi:hypothetical protein